MRNYYLQLRPSQSLRFFGAGPVGLRWIPKEGKWTTDCAPEECCRLTNDLVIDEHEAHRWIMASLEANRIESSKVLGPKLKETS